MGYNANGSGFIDLHTLTPEMKERINECLSTDVMEGTDEKGNKVYTINVWDDEKYYGDEIYEMLTELNPVTLNGSIRYNGEDGSIWEFFFDEDEKCWVEENAEVIWPSEKGPDNFCIEPSELYTWASKLMNASEIDHHGNGNGLDDLYLKKTKVSDFLVGHTEFDENDLWEYFETDGEIWYDLPFLYTEKDPKLYPEKGVKA